ncbi:MAG: hypothetical protein WD048_16335 [Chitinophagales bacterium]
MFEAKSYPRAALIGNPSDGYFGKCIAFVFSDFSANVKAEVGESWQIISPAEEEQFPTIEILNQSIREYGYFGGKPLMLASLKVFTDFAKKQNWKLPDTALSIKYSSDIPLRVGLAGSSALITALFRVLLQWADKEIAPTVLANLVLSVEKEELGIGAGLQDRVAQAYEHPVFMDFDKSIMEKQGFGQYHKIKLDTIQDCLFIVYSQELSEGSEVVHNTFQKDFSNNKPEALRAIESWKSIADAFYSALQTGNNARLAELMNENFKLREKVMPLQKAQVKLVKKVSATGVAAKFCGSGGAVLALADSPEARDYCCDQLRAEGLAVIKPQIVYSQA